MTDEEKNYCSQLEARGNIIRASQYDNIWKTFMERYQSTERMLLS